MLHRQLRCEVSAGQLAVLSARAELSATQEELRASRAVADTEKFPDLLLSSLDKLFEDKQQQLWLVSWAVARNVKRISPDQTYTKSLPKNRFISCNIYTLQFFLTQ